MPTLGIDIETFSPINLIECGVYRYTEDPDFTILMIAYKLDDGPTKLIDLCGEKPKVLELLTFKEALLDPEIRKTAYNANFERICLGRMAGLHLPIEQWECTEVHAATLGLPRKLKSVTQVLGLPEDKQKLREGGALIRYFSKPVKATKSNGFRTRNLPEHDREKWERFKEYCRQDVEVEYTVRNKLAKYPVMGFERKLWFLDQQINDIGVFIDRQLVDNAIECDEKYWTRLDTKAKELTGLENPNSVAQLKDWLGAEGLEVEKLTKGTVPDLIKATQDENIKDVLRIRQEMAKTSVSKYHAMARSVNKDGRIRGLLRFYGANRTGRWAGQLVQVQNLPQNKLDDLSVARETLRNGDFEGLEMLYGNIPDTLSQLIRTAFIPAPSSTYYVADFSAIEARVIAWLAGETWRMEVFKTHGKIYEASASQMFKIPLERIKKGNPEYALRQKGKIAELALGYGGSKGALISMGALKMGLEEEELPGLVNAWRNANKAITKLWWNVGDAAIQAVKHKAETTETHGIQFSCESGFLFIRLPSGRRLAYVRPRITLDDRYGRDKLTYEGIEQGKNTWGRIDTYGPKIVENIIQAISRDCLANSMVNLANAGYKIIMHVHDEVIVESTAEPGRLEEIEKIMGVAPGWAAGLPLRADGYQCEYYKKE